MGVCALLNFRLFCSRVDEEMEVPTWERAMGRGGTV